MIGNKLTLLVAFAILALDPACSFSIPSGTTNEGYSRSPNHATGPDWRGKDNYGGHSPHDSTSPTDKFPVGGPTPGDGRDSGALPTPDCGSPKDENNPSAPPPAKDAIFGPGAQGKDPWGIFGSLGRLGLGGTTPGTHQSQPAGPGTEGGSPENNGGVYGVDGDGHNKTGDQTGLDGPTPNQNATDALGNPGLGDINKSNSTGNYDEPVKTGSGNSGQYDGSDNKSPGDSDKYGHPGKKVRQL